MKKEKQIIALCFVYLILFTRIISIFHQFEHINKDNSAEVYWTKTENVSKTSLGKECFLCDFLLKAEKDFIPSFSSIFFIPSFVSIFYFESITGKKTSYIYPSNPRAPPYLY